MEQSASFTEYNPFLRNIIFNKIFQSLLQTLTTMQTLIDNQYGVIVIKENNEIVVEGSMDIDSIILMYCMSINSISDSEIDSDQLSWNDRSRRHLCRVRRQFCLGKVHILSLLTGYKIGALLSREDGTFDVISNCPIEEILHEYWFPSYEIDELATDVIHSRSHSPAHPLQDLSDYYDPS